MKSNPYGSMLYLYNGVHTMFTKEVGVLGKIIIPVQLN